MNNSFTSQLIYCYAKCMNNMSKTGCASSKGNECPAPIRSRFLIGYLGTCARPVANQNVKFMCQLYLFPVFVLFLKGLLFFFSFQLTSHVTLRNTNRITFRFNLFSHSSLSLDSDEVKSVCICDKVSDKSSARHDCIDHLITNLLYFVLYCFLLFSGWTSSG